ncbi:helix-turn-helix domain-containing protein [Arthrobacter bussei]|uniref:Helix-turn-helix domain-containing protein n=1 Tax=Arthrobacter bussei TaxID=2594179 RepID=A0A7X1NNM8_9MICC|nr:helix-turn-helix domain-containing protein [Arthrobacter bussei]MPY10069.1 helix-turn-helix domain-containing protein [Arthrobacter bussei]
MADGINFSDVQFLTVAEVADLMRVSKMTVYRLVHAGDLPAVQFGRSYRVPESAVEEFLQRAQVEGQSESA